MPRDCGARNDGKKVAFTLAETLITLAIIGIIAALTIPNLIHKYQVAQTVSKLTKVHATVAHAFKMAEIENGPAYTWDVGTTSTFEGTKKLAEIFFPYLKVKKICGYNSGCFPTTYKTLQNTGYSSGHNPGNTGAGFYRAMLEDGSSIYFWSGGNSNGNLSAEIGIDINGLNAPNRSGIDYFSFNLNKNGIIPHGTTDSEYCKHSGTNNRNGKNCTAWVIYKKNMDYTFRDISWDE